MAVKRERVLRICLEGRNRREVALSPPVAYLFGCFRDGYSVRGLTGTNSLSCRFT